VIDFLLLVDITIHFTVNPLYSKPFYNQCLHITKEILDPGDTGISRVG